MVSYLLEGGLVENHPVEIYPVEIYPIINIHSPAINLLGFFFLCLCFFVALAFMAIISFSC